LYVNVGMKTLLYFYLVWHTAVCTLPENS